MKMEEYIRGIPSGLLTAQLGEREIQVVGISENGFEFRLEKKAARQLLTDAVPAQHLSKAALPPFFPVETQIRFPKSRPPEFPAPQAVQSAVRTGFL